ERKNERIHLLQPSQVPLSNPTGVYRYFYDANGNYWICTSTGVFKVRVEKRLFHQYFTSSVLPSGTLNQARGIALTHKGNLVANIWEHIASTDSLHKHLVLLKRPNINYALLYANGKLYVGNQQIDRMEDNLSDVTERLFNAGFNDVWVMAALQDTALLIGSDSGVCIGSLTQNKLLPIRYKEDIPVKAVQPYRFVFSNNQDCWVATFNGFFRLNLATHTVTNYFGQFAADDFHKLPPVSIYDAQPAGENAFWLATKGIGLIHLEVNTGKQQFIRKVDGLPSDILYRIETDNIGRLWISTDNGLCCYDPQKKTFDNFSTEQGITHNEFNRVSSYKAEDGRLFFGGLNGVIGFHPLEFSGNALYGTEPLRITGFSQYSAINNKLEDQLNDLQHTGKITLQPGDRFFTLDFVLLDYRNGSVNYAYRIEGMDNEWNALAANTLRISGLPAGNYVLHVRGQNVLGKWSESELSIPITVLAPLWKQSWFIIFMSIAFLLTVYLWYKMRTRQLVKAKHALERTVEKRTAQLKDLLGQKDLMMKEIHHRVKNNLQVISGLLELQKARTTDAASREALEESQNRVLSIAFIHQNLYEHEELKGVEMKSFIHDLSKHISSVFVSDTRKPVLSIEVDEIRLDIETALPLGLILNELLTNSYKHAFTQVEGGEIDIELKKALGGAYQFRYQDNGAMKEEGDKSKGTLGMRLIQQLSRQINGIEKYNNTNGFGYDLEFLGGEQRRQLNE
ncbi:MAG TPA: histidine kinase dimerization/phosphoacceptor domain -containing protein, partial [Phnomibacter sp.]|nr:histidine kinase dimerization/phosphoacceptor domain -containing protein [Phnomibacter sp.]